MTSTPPNIVMVVLDSVRRDHVSCYGHARETTPNLDRLAGEGIRFQRASATSCWTLPSHASLFTGLYPSRHRTDLDTGQLPPDLPTLAGRLDELGYRTASISCNGFISESTDLTRGFDLAVDVESLMGGGGSLSERVVRGLHRRWREWTRRDRGTRRATRRARRWIGESTPEGPFFLFMNYMDCHLPYALDHEDRYRFVEEGAEERVDDVPQDPFGVMAGKVTMSSRDLEDLRSLYDGCLHYLDRHLGQLVDQLRREDVYDDTVIVVTADHGESFGEHGLMDHQYGLYGELLDVPLVIRLPGGDMGGETDDRLIQLVDLCPTLLELAGGEPTFDTDPGGRSLLHDGPVREASFAEYLVPNTRAIRRRFPDVDPSRYDTAMRAITTDRYRLISRRDGRAELFDLDADPGERSNLANRRPDLVTSLTSHLEEALGEWPEWVDETPPGQGDEGGADGMEAVRDRLEALGYL